MFLEKPDHETHVRANLLLPFGAPTALLLGEHPATRGTLTLELLLISLLVLFPCFLQLRTVMRLQHTVLTTEVAAAEAAFAHDALRKLVATADSAPWALLFQTASGTLGLCGRWLRLSRRISRLLN